MVFNDYYQKIKFLLNTKYHNDAMLDHNLDKIFENYINDIPINECVNTLLKNYINESKNNINYDFKKYTSRVKQLLETMGYEKSELTDETNKQIADAYSIEEDEYACAELCKDNLQKKTKQYNVNKLTKEKIEQVKNNLIVNLHNINNAALLKLNVSPTVASIKIKIRLISNLKYIDTDVKSYIKQVHKYLSAFITQNNNNELETNIESYSIKYNNLYCISKIQIPLIGDNKFNIYDISKNIKSYLNVIETFAEQYKNIIQS